MDYSRLQRNQDDVDDNEDAYVEMNPTGTDLGRTRASYNAARIHAKIVYSRALANEILREAHNASTPLGFNASPPAADAEPQHNEMVRPPMTPDRNGDGDVVNLGATIDGRKGRDITVVSEAVYYKGIEYYVNACWAEPSEDIRPSIQQSACILELRRCGSLYVDFSLMTPHDVRTSKSRI